MVVVVVAVVQAVVAVAVVDTSRCRCFQVTLTASALVRTSKCGAWTCFTNNVAFLPLLTIEDER